MSTDQHQHTHASGEETAQQHFPCEQCGADLTFKPGTQTLHCDYCGHDNHVVDAPVAIKEYSFEAALEALAYAERHPLDSTQVIKCPNCSATFELKTNQHAGDCPFCGTPVVTSTEHSRHFQPKSLLPFAVTEKQAQDAFDRWISGLWFAPSSLKNKAKRDERLLGIYVPYWTYDSHTDSVYRGQRGTTYYERQVVHTVVNGRRVRQVVSVPRIRWTPVSGRVRQFFDDVLVGATQALPRKILDSIQPWDLDNLVPYNQAYLSGFQSEIYQVDLDEGFAQAREIMGHNIRQAVRYDIGGDHQQIHSLNTRYDDTTFKHVLLPVWAAAFRYKGDTYRFIINARNGKTQGERPYSKTKIILAVLLGFAVLFGAFWYMESTGILNDMTLDSLPSGYDTYYYR